HRLWPRSPHHTTIECDWYFDAGVMETEGFDPSDAVDLWDLINRQDWSVCQRTQLGTQSRAWRGGRFSGQESQVHDFEQDIAARRPVVFERLLRIEHLSRWFCGWCRIEPRVGGTFKFGGETCIIPPEGRAWETTIEEGDVLRRFAFTWPIQSAKTRVSYELEDSPGDTAV